MSQAQIFVPGVGQYENIGDIILRRQLIEWLRPLGRLHVYVGPSPDGYATALGVGDDAVVYRSFGTWYRAGLRSAARGDGSYVFKPGEIQLTLVGMKEHLSMLPMAGLMRARGGRVARIGAGSRNFAPLPRLLITPSIMLSQLTAWRDVKTVEYLGRGELMPDLAFAEGPEDFDHPGERDTIVVSMRVDRPLPTAEWISGIRSFADANGLRIVVATQVLPDSPRSIWLADRLGAELQDWDGADHEGQELALRETYRRTALAISDRMHVLIAAYTEGAVPIALLVDRSDKIDRHFQAAGIRDVSVATDGMDAASIEERLGDVLARRAEMMAALTAAKSDLESVRGELAQLLTGHRASPVPAGVR